MPFYQDVHATSPLSIYVLQEWNMSMQPGQLCHVHIGGSPCGRIYTGRFFRHQEKWADHQSQDDLGSLPIDLSRIFLEDS
eukprot:5173559-Ditylum_brightwellii.AAC.1